MSGYNDPMDMSMSAIVGSAAWRQAQTQGQMNRDQANQAGAQRADQRIWAASQDAEDGSISWGWVSPQQALPPGAPGVPSNPRPELSGRTSAQANGPTMPTVSRSDATRLGPGVQSNYEQSTLGGGAGILPGMERTSGPQFATRYQLRNTPDGKVIYDTQSGANYALNMASPEMLTAVGLPAPPAQGAKAGTGVPLTAEQQGWTDVSGQQALPNWASVTPPEMRPAPRPGAANVPLTAEQQGWTDVSGQQALPKWSDVTPPETRPGYKPPTPTPSAALSVPGAVPAAGAPSVGPGARAYGIPRMRLPANVDYTGSASSIFGNYAGTAGGGGGSPAPQVSMKPAPQFSVQQSQPQSGTRYNVMSGIAGPSVGGGGNPNAPQDPGGPMPPGPQGPPPTPDQGPGAGPPVGPPNTGLNPPATGFIWQWLPVKDATGAVRTNPDGTVMTAPELVPDPTYQRPAPLPQQTPEQAAATEAQAALARAQAGQVGQPPPQGFAPVNTPEGRAQIIAATGLTNAQISQIEQLLPGQIGIQNATIDQIVAGIRNSNMMTGAQVDQIVSNLTGLYKGAPTLAAKAQQAAATGYYGTDPTLSREALYGFGPTGTPTLAALQQQAQNALGYAASARADIGTQQAQAGLTGYDQSGNPTLAREGQQAGITGYDLQGNPTLAREGQVSDATRANLVAEANIGNQAAQIRLREIDQAEAQRQYNTTFGEGQRQYNQNFEAQRRQNPASVFDQVWNNRGGAQIPTPSGGGAGGGQQMSTQQMPGVEGMMGTQEMPQSPGAGASAQYSTMSTPSQSGPLTYNEIKQSGAEPPGIAAATSGSQNAPAWRPVGGMPNVSGQAYNRLNPSERQVFDAQLSATGNSPQDYQFQRQQLTAAPVRSGPGFSAPRPMGAF